MGGCFLFKFVSQSETRVSSQVALDLNMPLLDNRIMDYLMKTFAPLLLPMMAKQARARARPAHAQPTARTRGQHAQSTSHG